jgi:MinD superfamily P-loop ATPase
MEIVKAVDRVVLVTEPTPFGLHDLVLAVEMTRALGKPLMAVVNRSDLGNNRTQEYLASDRIEQAAQLPDLPEVAAAYAHGRIAAEASPELCTLLLPLERRLIAEASS